MGNKILKILVLLLALTMTLTGCGGTEDVYSEWIELVEVSDETDTSEENSSQADTLEESTSSDNTVSEYYPVGSTSGNNSVKDNPSKNSSVESTQNVAIGDTINITNKGKSNYTIVASLSNDGYDQARFLQKVIRATSGASIPLISDYETASGPEIVIGDTSRPLSATLKASLDKTEYLIKVTDEGDIYIVGKSLIMLETGVERFLSAYFGYDKEATKVGKELPIPAKLNIKESVLDGYELVWYDEFNVDTFDGKKWNLHNHMAAQSDLKTLTDEKAVFLKDGTITLRADRVDENTYSTNSSLATNETMIFKYGYVEMRAKVPYGDAVFPSLWMKSSEYGRSNPFLMGEIDIFEVFASPDSLAPNLHKWYSDGSGEHIQLPTNQRGGYSFKNSAIAKEWHTYGMLWTEDSINFMVDKEIYHSVDISTLNDMGTRGDGMDVFHDYYYLIMNNYLMTENGVKLGTTANKDTIFPIDYIIDYVRLYQKDGVGDLIVLS